MRGITALGLPRVLAGVTAGALAFFVTPAGVRETPQQTIEHCRAVVLENKLVLDGVYAPSVLRRLAARSVGLEARCLKGTLRSAP